MEFTSAQQSDILMNEDFFIYILMFFSYHSPQIYVQWIYGKPIYK